MRRERETENCFNREKRGKKEWNKERETERERD